MFPLEKQPNIHLTNLKKVEKSVSFITPPPTPEEVYTEYNTLSQILNRVFPEGVYGAENDKIDPQSLNLYEVSGSTLFLIAPKGLNIESFETRSKRHEDELSGKFKLKDHDLTLVLRDLGEGKIKKGQAMRYRLKIRPEHKHDFTLPILTVDDHGAALKSVVDPETVSPQAIVLLVNIYGKTHRKRSWGGFVVVEKKMPAPSEFYYNTP